MRIQMTGSYRDGPQWSLRILLLSSLAVAALSFVQPWIWSCAVQPWKLPWPFDPCGAPMLFASFFGFAAIWALMLVISLILHGIRGLWVLVGAPLALYVPIVWSLYVYACSGGVLAE